LHQLVAVERGQHGGEDGTGRSIGGRADAVVHPFAFAAGGDDAGLAQEGKVPGDFGLALAQDCDQVADADLATGDEVEQAEPRGVSKRGEHAGQIGGI